MTYRIRVRVHEVEVEYDVSAEPTGQDVLTVLSAAADLHREISCLSRPTAVGDDEGGTPPGRRPSGSPINGNAGKVPVGTVGNILSTLEMKSSGPNFLLAAALHLTLEKGKPRFTRKELLGVMQKARGYDKNMSKNLTGSIASAMKKQRLKEPRTNEYSVAPEYLNDIREQLAQ